MSGGLFTVTYTLRVFVKHDSWNEFGEGNCIILPLKIMQHPVEVMSTDILKSAPSGWNPKVAGFVELALPHHDPSDSQMPGHYYYKKVIEHENKRWKDEKNHRVSMVAGKPPPQ
jgi:hypothetical protein